MKFLNAAIFVFTLALFAAILGQKQLATYGAWTSAVLASVFVIEALFKRFIKKS
ncbi:hypothetical protein [Glaciecola sp. KUL10]|jgi:uncharacterized protein (DUF58 family)|uniref:hypothetical protein n=1 Tax=Glaciecola sp. (strain KUL10) TaxID=2161813 RepID=UPI000D99D433|nr:hypothetical protein [Glaciecola sp. KUL10]GBL04522.1 hypothetical protein KUL10_18280 [Glaciecola sp. KUL10]